MAKKDKKRKERNQNRDDTLMQEFAEEVVPVSRYTGGGGTLTEDEQIQRKKER